MPGSRVIGADGLVHQRANGVVGLGPWRWQLECRADVWRKGEFPWRAYPSVGMALTCLFCMHGAQQPLPDEMG